MKSSLITLLFICICMKLFAQSNVIWDCKLCQVQLIENSINTYSLKYLDANSIKENNVVHSLTPLSKNELIDFGKFLDSISVVKYLNDGVNFNNKLFISLIDLKTKGIDGRVYYIKDSKGLTGGITFKELNKLSRFIIAMEQD